ncbi:DUF6090 family protein [Allomuricauda sp. NBRC 101325]|uniref:DUF6090 family protein n=1 Tax=Allomuricauda sp. NBRC 101325 TaxID=1113758 RepID=UPI0024A0D23D|nr:DUF6090 family protein [Muricauda sp. NBRC 101325]GLU44705.1 hypothetical protein Musp01_23290 [Muricauda sp. NBRC 101325]
MPKFFRKTRQKSVFENRITKYILYAIGEIILVVIGILIAVNINNWNNKQEDRQTEITLLKEIKNSLLSNYKALDFAIELETEQLEHGKFLLNHLKNKRPFNDTIVSYLSIPLISYQNSYNNAAFENLKSEGLPYISNDSLKLDISFIYETRLKSIFTDFPAEMENIISNTFTPFYIKNFVFESLEDDALLTIPNNYDELIKNQEMSNIVSVAISMKTFAIARYTNTQKYVKRLHDKIHAEIKKLESL